MSEEDEAAAKKMKTLITFLISSRGTRGEVEMTKEEARKIIKRETLVTINSLSFLFVYLRFRSTGRRIIE